MVVIGSQVPDYSPRVNKIVEIKDDSDDEEEDGDGNNAENSSWTEVLRKKYTKQKESNNKVKNDPPFVGRNRVKTSPSSDHPKLSQGPNQQIERNNAIKYCHFMNNTRKGCQFSSQDCRFSHEKAPDCKFGTRGNCKNIDNFRRCNFSHSDYDFLEDGQRRQRPPSPAPAPWRQRRDTPTDFSGPVWSPKMMMWPGIGGMYPDMFNRGNSMPEYNEFLVKGRNRFGDLGGHRF